jgi:hypothetical protein
MLKTRHCQLILNKGYRYVSVLSSKNLDQLEPSQVSDDGTTEIYTPNKKPLSERLKKIRKEGWKPISNKPYNRK